MAQRAENRIHEAIERGDLRPPPPGTPLNLDAYFALAMERWKRREAP